MQGVDLYRAMLSIKDQGMVGNVGVSIYEPTELDALWPNFPLDLIQAPFNVVDRRLATSGWLARLHDFGCEVHIRSIFLQGLLLVDPVRRPARFGRWQLLWDEWHRWLQQRRLTPLQACMGLALSLVGVDRVLVGVDSLEHLQAILAATDTVVEMPPHALMTEDLALIDPRLWSGA
jgi:hypothetical protein